MIFKTDCSIRVFQSAKFSYKKFLYSFCFRNLLCNENKANQDVDNLYCTISLAFA